MIRLFCTLILASLCGVTLLEQTQAEIVYRQGEGWTSGAETEIEIKRNAEEQYSRAEQYEAEGDTAKAAASYNNVVRRFPRSEVASKAQFKYAELLEQQGDLAKAYDAYVKLIQKYPKSEKFEDAVGKQFEIAQAFLDGRRVRYLGIPTFASMQKAEDMFTNIIKNAPFSKYAPLAQFNLGVAHERQGEMPEAIKAYQAVVDKYPTNDIADDALYQIGFVYLTQARSGSYDARISSRARDAFEDFLLKYPDSEKAAQAKENLEKLTSRQISNDFQVAQFYDKQKNYKAAVIYYNEVIKQQPGSEDAEKAKNRINELKDQVGEDALRSAPEKAETGATAEKRRRLEAQVDTAARPDYVGPPAPKIVPDEVPEPEPTLRSSPTDVAPLPVEPELPE